jgi:arylsulfatase A-like enzyme
MSATAAQNGLVTCLLAGLIACGGSNPVPRSTRLVDQPIAITIASETRLAAKLDLGAPAAPGSAARQLVFEHSAIVPAEGRLRFAYGLKQKGSSRSAERIRFRVYVDEAVLFSRILDPAKRVHRRWFDEDIDLAPFAGESVNFRFIATMPIDSNAAFLPVWSVPEVYTSAPEKDRPNIILISLDTLRAQNLGCYGYERNTSPFLDELAAEGTLFERAITPSATTAPSHMSVFTGLYPPTHAVRTGAESKAPGVTTIATTLRAAGYRTAAFTENGFVIREKGAGEGFGSYVEHAGDQKHGAPGFVKVTFGQAGRWLEKNRQSPFFLFIHTYQVHWPYDPPPGYRKLFRKEVSDRVRPGLRKWRDDYDREIRYLDDELKKFFGKLESAGLAKSTLVILLADHGEEFGEHGSFQHGTAVFDEILRVPLIFWGPDRIPAGGRARVRVSLIDIAPTILDFAGIEIPTPIEGMSLRPAIVEGAALAERTIFSEAQSKRRWRDYRKTETFAPPMVSVLTGDKKYIIHRPQIGEPMKPTGYNLAKDPAEMEPFELVETELARVNRLVDDYLKVSPGGGGREPEATSAAGDPSESGFENLTPEVRQRLKLLGYIE